MSDENLFEFVTRRERELIAQISATRGQINLLHGQLAQREVELVEVQRIKAEIPTAAPPNSKTTVGSVYGVVSQAAVDLGIYERMTIKQLVVQALVDHFKKGGTMMDIRNFVNDAYGRNVLPSSLRPQLHRLKAAGILGQEEATDTWDFRDGKREKYTLYNHPTTTAGTPELQDDAPFRWEGDSISFEQKGDAAPKTRRELLYGDKPKKD